MYSPADLGANLKYLARNQVLAASVRRRIMSAFEVCKVRLKQILLWYQTNWFTPPCPAAHMDAPCHKNACA